MNVGNYEINICRKCMINMKKNLENNTEFQNEYNILKKNLEYEIFIAKTKLGQEIDEKLREMDQCWNNMTTTINELVNATNQYLNAQEKINTNKE